VHLDPEPVPVGFGEIHGEIDRIPLAKAFGAA